MDILLAFLGAIVGGFVTVQYTYVADRLKQRGEVMLEVVAYCDDIYHLIQNLHAKKDLMFKSLRNTVDEEYEADNKQLSVLIKTSIPHTKLLIAYGEGEAVKAMDILSAEFRRVVSMLRNSTSSAWESDNGAIYFRFENIIDPLRVKLQMDLLKGARARSIWQILFKG